MCDFVLSSSPYMTSTMYESAYRLVNVYPGWSSRRGTPAPTARFSTRSTAGVRRRLASCRSATSAATPALVVYAPTWRGASFADPVRRRAQSGRPRARGCRNAFGRLAPGDAQGAPAGLRPCPGAPEVAGLLVPERRADQPRARRASTCSSPTSAASYFDALATGLPVVLFAPDLDRVRRHPGAVPRRGRPPRTLGRRCVRSGGAVLVLSRVTGSDDGSPRHARRGLRRRARASSPPRTTDT